MRQGYRNRVAAVASAALLGGAPLLLGFAPAPAYARTESGREVVFDGGGLGVVSCGSRPSVSSLSVPAESTVRFVNKLNQGATLRLDGRDAARLARGEARPVLFHRGPVRVEMVPDCLADVASSRSAATVQVTRPATARPPASSGGGSAPAGGSAPSGAGRTSGGGAPTAERQQDGAPAPATGGGDGPGSGPSAAPGPAGPPGVATAPADGGSPLADGATVEETAGPQGWAAEPVAAAEPVGDTGPVGLLALIATVCVVGVSIGTIRAIITQRATRSSWA